MIALFWPGSRFRRQDPRGRSSWATSDGLRAPLALRLHLCKHLFGCLYRRSEKRNARVHAGVRQHLPDFIRRSAVREGPDDVVSERARPITPGHDGCDRAQAPGLGVDRVTLPELTEDVRVAEV